MMGKLKIGTKKLKNIKYKLIDFIKFFSQNKKVVNSYTDPEVVKILLEKTKIFLEETEFNSQLNDSDLQIMVIQKVANLKNGSVVIDFGGGAGIHYGNFKRNFPEIDINWIVIETDELVKQAKVLENSELAFSSSLSQAVKSFDEIDLVFSDSALQYCSNPISILNQLIETKPKNVILSRVMMTESSSYASYQTSMMSKNGPGKLPKGVLDFMLRVPVFITSKQDYIKTLKASYDIVYEKFESSVGDNLSQKEFKTFSIYAKLI